MPCLHTACSHPLTPREKKWSGTARRWPRQGQNSDIIDASPFPETNVPLLLCWNLCHWRVYHLNIVTLDKRKFRYHLDPSQVPCQELKSRAGEILKGHHAHREVHPSSWGSLEGNRPAQSIQRLERKMCQCWSWKCVPLCSLSPPLVKWRGVRVGCVCGWWSESVCECVHMYVYVYTYICHI